MDLNVTHGDTCDVVNVSNNMVVEAVVQSFQEKEMLKVILNKSVKLGLKWNGKVYEGNAAGLNFISHGPSITKSMTSRRG